MKAKELRSKPEKNLYESLLKAGDVARILNVSLAYAYQLMQRGEIPTVHMGRSRRVRLSDLEGFIEKHTYTEMNQYSPYLDSL